MFEKIVSVGERGQVTIPKQIRDEEGIKPKDKLIFKKRNGKNTFEKVKDKKALEKELEKGYEEMAKLSLEINEEWKYASKEADEMLDDY